MNKFVISIIVLSMSAATFALERPKSSTLDSRMQYLNYNANNVSEVSAKVGYATAIKFNEGEAVEDIAVGFPGGWDVQDSNNVLYLRPIAFKGDGQSVIEPIPDEWDTNLIVKTNKYHYVFDLKLIEPTVKNNTYLLRFSYPTEKAQAAAQAKVEAERKRQESIVNDELNSFTVPKNWDFVMKVGKDSRAISPDFAYDDGYRTYLGFANNKSIPAVFYYQGDQEMMSNTNQKQQGNYSVIVIHKTAPRFILRSGEQVVGLINQSYGKQKVAVQTTANPNVVRGVN